MIAMFAFLIAFIIARIVRGKEYAKDWLFDAFAGLCGIIVIGGVVFAYQLIFVSPQKIFTDQQSSISNLAMASNSLSITVSNLHAKVSDLQEQHQRDSSALEAVAAVTGATNGSFIQNAQLLSDKINDIRSDLKKVDDRLLAPKIYDTIDFSDSNRIAVLQRTNGGPVVFFKLKRMPISGTVEGIFQIGNESQTPAIIAGEQRNVVWMIFANLNSLRRATFSFSYLLNKKSTNLIQHIGVKDGKVEFDHTLLSYSDNKE